MENLRQRLLRHEGIRLRAYSDTRGFMTIGVGRNLSARGISEDEAMMMLDNDIALVKEQVVRALPWALQLDQARRDVLYEAAFQLGIHGLLGFKNTLAAIQSGNWDSASTNMLQSTWHTQTPARCEELAEIIKTGNLT